MSVNKFEDVFVVKTVSYWNSLTHVECVFTLTHEWSGYGMPWISDSLHSQHTERLLQEAVGFNLIDLLPEYFSSALCGERATHRGDDAAAEHAK